MVGALRHLYPFSLLGKSEADKDNGKSTLSACLLRLSAGGAMEHLASNRNALPAARHLIIVISSMARSLRVCNTILNVNFCLPYTAYERLNTFFSCSFCIT